MNQEYQPMMGKQPNKPKKKKKFWFWFRIVALILILIVGSFATYLYFKFDNTLSNIGTDVEVPEEESASVKPKTILLLGTDYREQTRSMNTDVIIIATLNPITKKAALVSIPRDTALSPEGFRQAKANSFYAKLKNREEEQLEQKIKKVYSDYLQVPIDYVLVFNFKAFSDTIDELGGVEVNVDMDMKYVDTADGTNIDLRAGLQTLNGKQALDYVRYRQSNRGTGSSNDFERNVRQEQVIEATLNQFKSFGGVFSLGGIFDAIGNNITSDIPSSEIKAMMSTYATINRADIEFVHLEGPWRSPYVYVAEEDRQKATAALKRQLETPAVPSNP